MAAPTTKVDICNLTMDHLGQSANISNIDTPTTEEEIKCSRWYDTTRRALLRAHPWTFARTRAQLSLNAVAPVFGYADAYNLPNDYIRLNFIGDDSIRDYKQRYALENKQLLLDNSGAASIDIGYTRDEDNVVKFDALFVDLLAVEQAWRLAIGFTLKPSWKKLLKETLTELRLEARAVNSQERPPIRIERSKFVEARRRITSNVAGKNTIFQS
jgi:hypothetical protein